MSTTRALIAQALADGQPWRTAQLVEVIAAAGGRPTAAKNAVRRMHDDGQVGAIRMGWDWFFFRDQQTADAYPIETMRRLAAEMAETRERKAKDAGTKTRFQSGNRARTVKRSAEVEAPIVVKSSPARVDPSAEADYSRAKVTRCAAPRYDARYQVDPRAMPYGAGFSAVGLGRDVTTGKGWGAQT